jgi:hypothetical protein
LHGTNFATLVPGQSIPFRAGVNAINKVTIKGDGTQQVFAFPEAIL